MKLRGLLLLKVILRKQTIRKQKKPNFTSVGSIREISKNEPLISFLSDDGVRNLLGFSASTTYEKYNLSLNPVDIISFDKFSSKLIAKRMIFKGRQSSKIQNFTMEVGPGCMYIEEFRGGVQWYMMESKDFSFKY